MTTKSAGSSGISIEVDLVLDPASLGHALGNLAPNHPDDGWRREGLIRPSLTRLIDLFDRRGLVPRHLTVVVPTVPVELGPASRPSNAREITERWSVWIDSEAASVHEERDCQLSVVHGGFDGSREVGVDELVAWTALQRASFDDAHSTEDRPVIVISADGDMWDLWHWASPRRILVSAPFDRDHRNLLKEGGVPFIYLDKSGLMTTIPDLLPIEVGHPEITRLPESHKWISAKSGLEAGDLVLTSGEHGKTEALEGRWSSALNRPRTANPPRTHFPRVRTIAVVDPYGFRNQALRAIGVAKLPRPESVRSTLDQIRFPGPIAVHCVIPDLDRQNHLKNLPDLLREAWNERDAELDHLHNEMTGDQDDTTHSRRASIRTSRFQGLLQGRNKAGASTGAEDASLLRSEEEWRTKMASMIKRLSTNMIAETWNALHHGSDQTVAIVSEDPDVYFALDQLASLDHRLQRVVRVGLHARRARRLASADAPGSSRYVVLTERLTAELCDVATSPYARAHRRALAGAVEGGGEWEVIGLDPESGGLVVQHEPTSPEGNGASRLQSVLQAGALEVDDRLAALLEGIGSGNDDIRVDLLFDPNRTCSVPQLRLTRSSAGDGGGEAFVVTREGEHLAIDTDGDGDADELVPIGHDTTSHPRGERIALRQLGGRRAGWALADPGPEPAPDTSRPLEVIDLTGATEDGEGRIIVTLPEEEVAVLLPVPGEPTVPSSGRILASRLTEEHNGMPTWLALSSALDHLLDSDTATRPDADVEDTDED